MHKTLGEILVLSDMDGTLVTAQQEILPCNLETIRLFTQMGGRFTVASGRSPQSIEIFPELCTLLSPGITSGGTVIYDFQQRKALRMALLPTVTARQALADVMEAFPQKVGVMIIGDDMRIYQLDGSDQCKGLFNDEQSDYFCRPLEHLPMEWNKVLFASSPEVLKELAAFVAGRNYPGVYFIATNPVYFEMMPEGVSKGSAIHTLCEELDVPVANTYMIGDYYNDVEIMQQAGYAVAMANAPSDVKAFANEVTASNAEGGVGQFLYKLVQKYASK